MTIIADQLDRIYTRRDRIENDLAMLSWKISSTNTTYDDMYTDSFLDNSGINSSLSSLNYTNESIAAIATVVGSSVSDFTLTDSIFTSSLEGNIIQVGGEAQAIDTTLPQTWSEITSVVANQTTPGATAIYHFVSFDNGITWMVFVASAWRTVVKLAVSSSTTLTFQYNISATSTPDYVTVADSDVATCLKLASGYAANQMTKTALEAITNAQWMSMIGLVPNCKLYFACALVSDVSFNVPTLTNYTFTYSTTFSNMTFVSNPWRASDINPTSAYCVVSLYSSEAYSLTTDIKIWISTNNGIDFEQFGSLTSIGSHGTNVYVRGYVDNLVARNTNTIVIKIQTLNNKVIYVDSLSIGLRYSTALTTVTTSTTSTTATTTGSTYTTGTTITTSTLTTTSTTSTVTTISTTTGTTTTTTTGTTISSTTQLRVLNPVNWTPLTTTGSAPVARTSHSSIYYNNKMYIFGGLSGAPAYLNDTYYLDLSTSAWSSVTCSGTPPAIRYGHVSGLDTSNRMYVYGGSSDGGNVTLTGVNRLDIATSTWSGTLTCSGIPPEGSSARIWNSAVVYNNSMYLFGGWTGTGYRNDINVLNLSTLAWTQPTIYGSIPAQRYGHTAIIDSTYNMYIFGGWGAARYNDVYKLNLSTMTWSSVICTGNPPAIRYFHSAIYSNDNKMYVFGGQNSGTFYNDIHCLNLTTLAWSQPLVSGTAPAERSQHSSILSDTGKMYVYAGSYGTPYSDTIMLGN